MKSLLFLLAMLIPSCATNQALQDRQQTEVPKGMRRIGQCPGTGNRSIKQGKVVMLIDVDRNGKASNIRIIESKPEGVWDESAICLTKLKTFKKNDKGEPPPFQNFREELNLKLLN